MEKNEKSIENSTVPHFYKNIKLKMGGEEEYKPAVMRNNINDINNNVQKAKERIQFLFPNLPPEDINKILEKSGNNIEQAINLIKELKTQKNQTNSSANLNQKRLRGIVKRNYNTLIQQDNIQNQNDINKSNNPNIIIDHANGNNYSNNNIVENNNHIEQNLSIDDSNNNNKNDIINEEKKESNFVQEINLNKNSDNNNQENKEINNNDNQENKEINNNDNSLDENTRNLINEQINYLLNKFNGMTDVSELKNLLKEIGFPLEKENNEKNDINKLEEELKEKIKSNKEERKLIINQYNKHNNFCKLIKLKEEKIDELTSSLGNLIDTESEQKMREEEYKNELVELLKVLKQNNNFNNPREGY